MAINVGTVDRAIRLALGVALIAAALLSGWAIFDGAVVKYITIIVGLVLAVTGLMRTCPAYAILGIRSCKV